MIDFYDNTFCHRTLLRIQRTASSVRLLMFSRTGVGLQSWPLETTTLEGPSWSSFHQEPPTAIFY